MKRRDMRVSLPEGSSGPFHVEHFSISEAEARLFNATRSRLDRDVRPGTYTRLMEGRTVWMSDTPAEQQDHQEAVERADGRCRVHGLGLGMVVEAMLKRPRVDRVEVVEASIDVIALVAPTLQARWGDRLVVIHADAYRLRPARGDRYGVVWHDIWPNLCSDNLPEMAALKEIWAPVAKWQGCWGEPECRLQRQLEGRR